MAGGPAAAVSAAWILCGAWGAATAAPVAAPAVATTAAAAVSPAAATTGAAPATVAPALRDTAFLGQYAATWRLRLGDPTRFTPTPGGDAVLFLRASSGRSRDLALWSFDPAGGKETRLATAGDLLAGAEETLTPEERARRERLRQTATGIASFELSEDGATVLIPLSSRLFLLDRASGRSRELESANGPAADAGLAPDGRSVAAVRDGSLWIVDAATGAERRLAAREGEDVTWGLAEFVAQEEMNRLRGFWWAPDSRRILAQRTDVAGVERLHISDPARPEQAPETWVYPRAGTRNADVRLWLFDTAAGDSLEVRWDRARWPYLCTVRWSAGAPPTLVVMNRHQTEAAVLTADEATGATRAIHVERDRAWLNLDQSVPQWVEGGKAWLWSTERNGEWQLELRSRAGARVRAVTTPATGYRKLLAADAKRGVAWVLGGDDPLEQHLVRVPLRAGGRRAERVTTPGGWHDGHFGGGGRDLWVEARERGDGARGFVVRRADGSEAGAIASHAETPLVTPRPEFLTVGPRALRVMVLRPAGFAAGRRYPVVLSVYGGPHNQDVTLRTRRMTMDQWLANQGFVVVSVDGRGTPNRGRAWERAIAGNLLAPAMNDQVEGLRGAARHVPEMDLGRVGVTGWSFGGTMTALALMTRPDVFHCGVSGAPVVDWRDYDTFYTERYLGLPDETPEAYRVSSPLTHAADLERPMLLIHGTADDNVYFFNSLKLLDALSAAGRAAEFLPLVRQTHIVRDPVAMRRIEERTVEFLKRHLGEPR